MVVSTRWTGGTDKKPLPIKGVYNADVDGEVSKDTSHSVMQLVGGLVKESNTYIKIYG